MSARRIWPSASSPCSTLFLTRKYERVELVFIRHTDEAEEVDEDTFFYDTQSGGTVVFSALELMQQICAARYPRSEWNIYAAQASDGDAFGADPAKSARFLREHLLPLARYFAYIEFPDENQAGNSSLWVEYEEMQRPEHAFAMRRVYSPTRSIRCSATCSARRKCERPHPWTAAARPGVGFRPARALRRGDRRDRRGVRARHLSEPDRDHQLRADARRLRFERPADRLSALVLRQGLHPPRAGLSQGVSGPRLRDRHQLQPLHRLSDGGELPDDAGAGDRARQLRPQLLLQGQLPVPAVHRGRCHPRLPGVRAALRDGVRAALRRRRGGRGARLVPCADGLRRGPLQAAAAAVGQGEGSAQERDRRASSSASSTISGARCRR